MLYYPDSSMKTRVVSATEFKAGKVSIIGDIVNVDTSDLWDALRKE